MAWSFADKYSLLAIQFGTSMVLARLLTPEAFGVFALAFAIVGFAHRIREMGVASYLVRKPDLQPVHIRSALFATGVVAWGIALLLLASLPLIERLFGADVRRATEVLLLNFLIMPVSSTIVPVLQREMNFAALLWINLTGVLANSLCAIGLAAAGSGYLALAWGSVVGQLAGALVAAGMRPHREHFLPSYADARNVFRFGSAVMLSTLLQQFTTNAANLIMARFISLQQIGFYTRAQSVTGLFARLIMQAIEPLILPVLSLMHRRGESLEPACGKGFSFLFVIVWPFYGFVALYAEPIVLVLFGRQWTETAIILRLLALAGMLEVVQPLADPLLIAIGRVDLALRAQVINQTAAVVGIVLAAPYGVVAIASTWLAICAIHSASWLFHLRRVVQLPFVVLLRLATTGAIVALAALALPVFSLHVAAEFDPLLRILIGGCGLGVGWLASVFAVDHPVAREIKLVVNHLVPAMRGQPKAARR
jgi:O-antigen/teichoic acid export membrane protein